MAEGFEFGLGADLGVAVGGGEIGVAEPTADYVDLDSGFEEMHGGGVAFMWTST